MPGGLIGARQEASVATLEGNPYRGNCGVLGEGVGRTSLLRSVTSHRWGNKKNARDIGICSNLLRMCVLGCCPCDISPIVEVATLGYYKMCQNTTDCRNSNLR